MALTDLRVYPGTHPDVQALVLTLTNRHEETLHLIRNGKVSAAVASVAMAYNALRDDDLQTAVDASRHAAAARSQHAPLAMLLLAMALQRQGENVAALSTLERTQGRLSTALEYCLYGMVAWSAYAERGESENAEAQLAILGEQLERTEHGTDISLTFTLAMLRYADQVNPEELTDAIRHAAELGVSLPALVHGSWMAEHLAKSAGLQDLRDFSRNMNGFLRDSPSFRAHIGIAMIQCGALQEGEALLKETEHELQQQRLSVLPRVRVHLALSASLQRPNDPVGWANIHNTLLEVASRYPANLLISDIRHLSSQYVHTTHNELIPRTLRIHIPQAITRKVTVRTLNREEVYYGDALTRAGSRMHVLTRVLAALKVAAHDGQLLDTDSLIHEVFGEHPDQMPPDDLERSRSDLKWAISHVRTTICKDLIVHDAENGRGTKGYYALREEQVTVDLDLFDAERLLRQGNMIRAGRILQGAVFSGDQVGPVLTDYHLRLRRLYITQCDGDRLQPHERTAVRIAVARMGMNVENTTFQEEARSFVLELSRAK